jgi:hypothetical protein
LFIHIYTNTTNSRIIKRVGVGIIVGRTFTILQRVEVKVTSRISTKDLRSGKGYRSFGKFSNITYKDTFLIFGLPALIKTT